MPIKRSKLPHRWGFAPGPTGEPLAGGEGNIPSPSTQPIGPWSLALAFGSQASGLAVSMDWHNVIDGLAPMAVIGLTLKPVDADESVRCRMPWSCATNGNSFLHVFNPT